MFHHINTPLWPMALTQLTSLHKLPMAVGKKSATSFHHGSHCKKKCNKASQTILPWVWEALLHFFYSSYFEPSLLRRSPHLSLQTPLTPPRVTPLSPKPIPVISYTPSPFLSFSLFSQKFFFFPFSLSLSLSLSLCPSISSATHSENVEQTARIFCSKQKRMNWSVFLRSRHHESSSVTTNKLHA